MPGKETSKQDKCSHVPCTRPSFKLRGPHQKGGGVGAECDPTPRNPANVHIDTEAYSRQQVIHNKRTTSQELPPDGLLLETGYQKRDDEDDLFYAPAVVEGKVELLALVDSRSTACTLGESAECILGSGNVIDEKSSQPTEKKF